MQTIDLTPYELHNAVVELPPHEDIEQAVEEFQAAIDREPEDDEGTLNFSLNGTVHNWVVQEVAYDSFEYLMAVLVVEEYYLVITTINHRPALVVAYEIPNLYALAGKKHALRLLGPRGPYLRQFAFSDQPG